MLLVCYNLLNSQNIARYLSINKQWKMVGYRDTSDVAENLLKLHRKKSNNWPMVSFIHNGSEITIWVGHSFKTKSTKSRATFLKITTSFFNFKLQIIRLAQRHWKKHLWKNIFSGSFCQRVFFCHFVDRKVLWFYCQSIIYLLDMQACFFFPY